MILLDYRAVKLSLRDRLTTMFTTASSLAGFANNFNIYGEADFRNVADGSFVPTFPYIFLLDSFMSPVETRLDRSFPQVVLEIDQYHRKPYEKGNRLGRWVKVLIHVFGQDRSQRDDLGAFIFEKFGNYIDLKQYSEVNPTGTVVETATLDDDMRLDDLFTARLGVSMNEALEFGSSLLGWSQISFSFLKKT